jgi:hypothetical protein
MLYKAGGNISNGKIVPAIIDIKTMKINRGAQISVVQKAIIDKANEIKKEMSNARITKSKNTSKFRGLL